MILKVTYLVEYYQALLEGHEHDPELGNNKELTKFRAPNYWENKDLSFKEFRKYQCSPEFTERMRRLMVSSDCGQCQPQYRIEKVERIENPILWKQYLRDRETLCEKRGVRSPFCAGVASTLDASGEGPSSSSSIPGGKANRDSIKPLNPPINGAHKEFIKHHGLDLDRLNEAYLFHGTKSSLVKTITEDEGFDERVSYAGGLYGAGIYFAEEACKSNQYVDGGRQSNTSNPRYMLYCRALLGNPK
jgi:hypothetical protein